MRTIILRDNKEYTEYNIDCPECGAPMILRLGKLGKPFYGCQDFRFNGCIGKITAHSDGTPTVFPESRDTIQARVIAKENFERVWKSGRMNKQEAFNWLCSILNVSRDKAYIDLLTIDQCELIIRKVHNLLKKL